MGNIKYIEKVVLPHNEECIFVDKTWRESPASKITKANIINWNTKFSKTLTENDIGEKIPPLENHVIPSHYIPSSVVGTASPQTLLLVYLTVRNDENIKLAKTIFNNENFQYEYTIQQKKQNCIGEIGNNPVKKVIINENNLYNQEYEIYFVADENFEGLFYIGINDEIKPIEYVYSNIQEYDFNYQPGHLYKITNGIKIKDCSNMDIDNYEDGIHQKQFRNIQTSALSSYVG